MSDYVDKNAERAGRFGGSDTKGLSEGRYNDGGGNDYGVDRGSGSWGYNTKRGLTGLKVAGPLGLAAGVSYTGGSPQINGGGWTGLGDSGQTSQRSSEGGYSASDRGGNGSGSYGSSGYGVPTENAITPSGTGSAYPSVYTDPVTGRLLYKSQSAGGTSNQSFSDQQMLDQIMGTSVAGQNLTQEMSLLKQQRAKVAAMGGDTSWYDSELERLNGLSSQSASTGGIMEYLNTGLQENVANQNLDLSNRNSMVAADEQAARRGMLGSPMRDATRASLGLSTVMGKQQNKLDAQNAGYERSTNLASYLKNSQQQDYNQEMGRTGIGMTLGDWENQRKIAEITQANQNNQFNSNMDYLKDQQSDTNRNAWIETLGGLAGDIDWGSLF